MKECILFDHLWNEELYEYNVTSKSFCSDYCMLGRHGPYWFECKASIMPQIDFFFAKDESCTVMTENGRSNTKNRDCLKQVSGSLDDRKFKKRNLVYITHGFLFTMPDSWLLELKDNLMNKYRDEHIAIGIVFWKHGARSTDFETQYMSQVTLRSIPNDIEKESLCCIYNGYGRASANTWPVGNILAYVNKEIANTSDNINTFCIGHSLGAHMCGFFGKMVKKLKHDMVVTKIIGLDPAGPIWQYKDAHLYQDPSLRLNKADALNVEVLHTSTWFEGFKDPLGDVDFYVNGGGYQPECWPDITGKCSHKFSHKLLNWINNKEIFCYAIWKCNVTNGSELANIQFENPSKLRSKGCSIHPKVKIGTLDITNNNNQGVYWVNVNNKSKTCQYNN